MDWNPNGAEVGGGSAGAFNPAQDDGRGDKGPEWLAQQRDGSLEGGESDHRVSWICGIITRARWCVNILYAVIAQALHDVKVALEGGARKSQ